MTVRKGKIESPRTGACLWIVPPPSVEDIRRRAYELWQKGAPGGARDHWLCAEDVLRADDELRSDDDLTRPHGVTRLLKQDMGRLPAHVHLDFAERFEVTTGVARAELDGDELRLTSEPSRSTLYVPPGVPHVNPYNEERTELVFSQSFIPGTDGTRSYVETLAAVLYEGRDEDGELPWPLILAVADVTRDRTYLTPVSRRARRGNAWCFALQRRFMLPVGRVVAGTRDFEVHLEAAYDPSTPASAPTLGNEDSETS